MSAWSTKATPRRELAAPRRELATPRRELFDSSGPVRHDLRGRLITGRLPSRRRTTARAGCGELCQSEGPRDREPRRHQ